MSFGLVDDQAVFADECSDSYFTLDVLDEGDLEALLAGTLKDIGPPLRQALGSGHEEVEIVRADPPAAAGSLISKCNRTSPRVVDVFRIANLLRRVRWRLRRSPIERVLREAANPDGDVLPGELQSEGLELRVRRFLAARRLIPLKANCLLDSLALLSWLGVLRRETLLVLGVKLDPFAAHCWVQLGDHVLNDHLESVTAFTPVRVIACSDATQ